MTFSLVGCCERTGAVGAVIASASMAVAARCAAVRAGVGAVSSQSTTDPRLRGELLDAIAGGVPAGDALAALAERTPDIAFRQLAVVDADGGAATYSGERALGDAADVRAPGAAAAGNLLAATGVPAAMLAAFTGRAGEDLGDRLIAALRAGLAAGGEVSPVRSAGMLVADAQPWPVTDLRVDWHDDPVEHLAGLWKLWRPQAESYVGRALRPSEMAQLCPASARQWRVPDERARAGRHRPVDAGSQPQRRAGTRSGEATIRVNHIVATRVYRLKGGDTSRLNRVQTRSAEPGSVRHRRQDKRTRRRSLMLSLGRRSAAFAGGATCMAALAALVIATTPNSSAQGLGAASSNRVAAQGPSGLAARPPLGRPKPSGQKADFHPADTASSASPWTALKNAPPFGTPGTMLLESDGTVLVHNEPDNNTTGGTNQWWKLTPAANGSYVNGTWSQIASMPSDYAPLYFGSAVLPDGRMIVEGGEYNGDNAVWSNQGEIYNPVTNTWKPVAAPKGWTSIGDSASEVLDNGTFMLQHPCNSCTSNGSFTVDDALLNAKTLTWKVIPATGKVDPNDEEGWTLEPNGKILTVDTWAPGNTELFSPNTDTWSFAGDTAIGGSPINPWPVVEIGPQVEMPGGNVFVVGAGSSTQEPPTPCTTNTATDTALYNYKSGSWSAGPTIPAIGGQEMDATDGPGATLPDGNVLFDASACVYNTPTHFFLYNAGSSTISQIPDVPNAPNDTSFATRFLDLPNGQVLFDDGSNQMLVYNAGGTPKASWRPSISWVNSTNLGPGKTYALAGKQLAGLDQGATYGDDVQDNTNFPLVRITNSATGVVTYARTTNWTSVSVAPGTKSATEFTLPPGTPAGKSTLVVVANGIASAPITVTVK